MNYQPKSKRHEYIDEKKDQYINARITTPQTYDEIKEKGTAQILKIASKGIVDKLLKRCQYYKGIIEKKTATIKSKNELIELLAVALSKHDPDIFKQDLKHVSEAVEKVKGEEVKTDLENEPKEELTKEEQAEHLKDNDNLDLDDYTENSENREKCKNCGQWLEPEKEHECPEKEDDPEPNDPEEPEEPEDLCGGENGGDIDIDTTDDIDEDKEDKDDETPED